MNAHVLVTGASRGLGAAVAEEFHRQGGRVSLFARSLGDLEAVARRLGDRCATYAGDISRRQDIDKAVAHFEASLGPVDILVNNAGIGAYKPFLDCNAEELTQQVTVNVDGVVQFAHAVARGMVNRRRGMIVNVASDLARKPLPKMAVYTATKHAVAGFSTSLARELKEFGVKVVLVNPGIINTHFGGGSPQQETQGWQLDPRDLASLIATLAQQPANVLVDEITVHPMGQDFWGSFGASRLLKGLGWESGAIVLIPLPPLPQRAYTRPQATMTSRCDHLPRRPCTMSSTATKPAWKAFNPPPALAEVLDAAPSVTIAYSVEDLLNLACGGAGNSELSVGYDLPDGRHVEEVVVARVRNGIAANYVDPYMRRRDPDCMVIGDNLPTDKKTFQARFGYDFEKLRHETYAWLRTQPLAMFAFRAGRGYGYDSIAIVPANAGFFALGLALLQGIVSQQDLGKDFSPKGVIYTAPPFRHTHFEGKQVVVHHRGDDLHEMFSYNLYPGPSAKKGVYGMLLAQGERESWVTAHCSTVRVITPYDNELVLMHEGASGGGKSEMLQHPHRLHDGRLMLGKNVVTGEVRYVELPRTCDLFPVTDDMALCHPSLQKDSGRLVLTDAEDGWFVRVDHIREYGTDPHLEKITAAPKRPLLFMNIDAVPNSRALIWEHIEDEPGKPCPNPRVILPRDIVPGVVDEAVEVQVRSLGVRTPPCTRDSPSYGIIGIMHLLPPALAWLWRLVAPRGHANPSIVSTQGMSSEGVGSYWPFATGRRVDQANLLLDQFVATPKVRYILTPNQHIGAWSTSFMPQWLAREYLARRGGAKFKEEHLRAARCPLLGQALHTMTIEGRLIPRWFLQVDTQPEVGPEAYDRGAEQLYDFFRQCLAKFNQADLQPLGRDIIQCCLDKGTHEDYAKFIEQQ